MTVRENADTGFTTFPHECQPGSRAALAWMIDTFHLASAGCLSETSQLSGGGWSWHKYGKAIDLGCWYYDANDRADGDRAFAYVLQHAEMFGLQQMIWGPTIVDIRDGYKVRYYSGSDHYNHIHIAMSYGASQHWQSPPEPTKVEDEMFRIIKGDVYGDLWLTNWLARRHIGTKAGASQEATDEANAIIAAGVTNGAGIVTWPQQWVNNIPEQRTL